MYCSCVAIGLCTMILCLSHIAHMWFGEEVHEANTNEDIQHPDQTKRVSIFHLTLTLNIVN